MLPDIENLIRLQQLDDFVETARRTIAEQPARAAALDDRLTTARARLAEARQRAADSQAARRALEKDLSTQQGRLARFKDQLMAVKTNREYTAMQHEIEVAQQEVRGIEDRILENMLEQDDVLAAVKAAEATEKTEQRTIEDERRALAAEVARFEDELEDVSAERQTVVAQISPEALAIYQTVAPQRRGIAVAPARDGLCSICHVRLRPQVFNDIRRNDTIIQCDSCRRILYFVPPPSEVISS
jgi:uncharacterized protein